MLVLEVTWLEVKLFLNHGGKISTCFLKLHSTCPKEDFKKKLFLKILFFFQTLRQFERTFTVLGEKVFGRDIEIEKCSIRLIRSIKKSIFESSLFFKFFRSLNEQLPCLAEKFWEGYQNWKLYSKSSEYHVADKNNFWKFCKFSFYSDLEQNFFGFVATEFSPGLSKRNSRCLYESSSRCWY